MIEVPCPGVAAPQNVDVCSMCQFMWFDRTEYEALPQVPLPTPVEELPEKVREELALLTVALMKEQSDASNETQQPPDEWWQWIPADATDSESTSAHP